MEGPVPREEVVDGIFRRDRNPPFCDGRVVMWEMSPGGCRGMSLMKSGEQAIAPPQSSVSFWYHVDVWTAQRDVWLRHVPFQMLQGKAIREIHRSNSHGPIDIFKVAVYGSDSSTET